MKITIFGDSITNGFGMDEGGSSNIIARLIEKNEPKLKVVLHGINGDDASPYHLIRPARISRKFIKNDFAVGCRKNGSNYSSFL